jgi:hypothetical protein
MAIQPSLVLVDGLSVNLVLGIKTPDHQKHVLIAGDVSLLVPYFSMLPGCVITGLLQHCGLELIRVISLHGFCWRLQEWILGEPQDCNQAAQECTAEQDVGVQWRSL